MKKFVTLLFMIICSASFAGAQTFLEHIQKKENGKASVKVNQSKEIDELVNGKATAKQATPNNKPASTPTKPATPATTKPATHTATTTADKTAQSHKAETPRTPENNAKPEERHPSTQEADDSMLEIPTIDMRKKVMRQSYKVNGYRVQAYAGGNSRADRRRAEEARDKIKQILPYEPVYVHFYSPRWICRVGNYRSYEEAARILQQIKALGYRQATIVRGKITVQY